VARRVPIRLAARTTRTAILKLQCPRQLTIRSAIQAVVSSPIDGTGDQNRDLHDAVVSSPIDGTDDQKRESLTIGISSSSPIGSTEGRKREVDTVGVDSRDVSINVQVAHGLSLHEVSAPAQASFGMCLSLPSKRIQYFRYIFSPRLSRRCWFLLRTFASFASRIYLWFASVGGLVVATMDQTCSMSKYIGLPCFHAGKFVGRLEI
jgi:hypothetical protein